MAAAVAFSKRPGRKRAARAPPRQAAGLAQPDGVHPQVVEAGGDRGFPAARASLIKSEIDGQSLP
jgi:hypothetical protein